METEEGGEKEVRVTLGVGESTGRTRNWYPYWEVRFFFLTCVFDRDMAIVFHAFPPLFSLI